MILSMSDSDTDIHLIAAEAVSAAGRDLDAAWKALVNESPGLKPNTVAHCELETFVGKVDAADDTPLAGDEQHFESRNNRLIALALSYTRLTDQIALYRKHYGAARLGLVMGSSTSSIDRTEEAYRQSDLSQPIAFTKAFSQPQVFTPHAPGIFAAHRLAITGPTLTVNTACSSSAKVFATAKRWLDLDLVDAVVVGGADSLCMSVMHGFDSLQLVSKQVCKPFDAERDGINLGEAACFTLLTRSDKRLDKGSSMACTLKGFGESSDAHHMSHPHPEGAGAKLALEKALRMANCAPGDIDYVNLHGTASRANDLIEGRLIKDLFPATSAASSTKGWTGHTLGAAGIIESLFAIKAMEHNYVPASLNFNNEDDEIGYCVQRKGESKTIHHVMSNSFGFGGNNASLIFAKAS